MRPIDADALIEFCAERWIPLNVDAVNMQPTIQPENAQLSQQGTTSDLISRQEAIDALDDQIKKCCKALGSFSLSDVDTHAVKVEMASLRAYREMLENLPTVQPEPQEGHWIGKYPTTYICSECGWLIPDSKVKVFAYCPNCGAKMTISTK